ncbi:MAG: multiheme c-type cytochrome [Polyangiaceae bacterium]
MPPAASSASGAPSAPPAASSSADAVASAPDDPVAARNRECERCHEEVAAEWRGSLHHQAWDDPVFLTAYAIEPLGFCRECHVPEANPFDSAPPAALRRLGIGCVTCHVRDGAVLGVTSLAGSKDGHAVSGDAALGTVQACARCHEFDFPEKQKALMQSTVTEHAASAHAKEPCRDCHMPLVSAPGKAPHRSHDFRVLGNTTLLRSAVTARAERLAGDNATVLVTLAAARIGHDFPTGDMFRRLSVRARVLGGEGESHAAPRAVVTRQGEGESPTARAVVLAREFEMVPGKSGIVRKQTGDKRLPSSGAPRPVRITFSGDVQSRPVHWQVVYQRMSDTMSEMFGVDPAADEVILAEGTLPAKAP